MAADHQWGEGDNLIAASSLGADGMTELYGRTSEDQVARILHAAAREAVDNLAGGSDEEIAISLGSLLDVGSDDTVTSSTKSSSTAPRTGPPGRGAGRDRPRPKRVDRRPTRS